MNFNVIKSIIFDKLKVRIFFSQRNSLKWILNCLSWSFFRFHLNPGLPTEYCFRNSEIIICVYLHLSIRSDIHIECSLLCYNSGGPTSVDVGLIGFYQHGHKSIYLHIRINTLKVSKQILWSICIRRISTLKLRRKWHIRVIPFLKQ